METLLFIILAAFACVFFLIAGIGVGLDRPGYPENQARRFEKLARKYDKVAFEDSKRGFYSLAKNSDEMAEKMRARAQELRGED